MPEIKFKTPDDYFENISNERIQIAQKIRKVIKEAIPEAEEVISYNLPAYRYKGILVYFAVFKNHIGFYPTPSGIEAFEEKLTKYEYAKGSVKFSLNEQIPFDLIQEICKFRFNENKLK